MRPGVAAAVLALATAACGKASEPAPQFTWVSVPGMTCADGSATGIGLSRGSGDVLVFLNGGGACWDACHCEASPGPFGPEQLALGQAQALAGTILDRSLAGNPFAGFTMVFVPYCTGDVHAGDAVQSYAAMGATCPAAGTWRHHGHRNVDAALAWIGANLPPPTRIVLAGSSAGGFGALLAFDLVRSRWPVGSAVAAALLDDSGPTFEPATATTPGLSPLLVSAWWDSWGLGSTVTPVCPSCSSDLSQIWTALSARYPGDPLALLSTTDDPTIEGFFGLSPADFATALSQLADDRVDPLPNAATFRSAAQGHALLASPASYQGGTTPLLAWLDPVALGTGALAPAGP